MTSLRIGSCELRLVKGDITRIAADAIVNAANAQLAGGGGVDGAIHRAGGPLIMRELDAIRGRIGRCETGNAVVTTAGSLPAKYVFHAVGPVYRDGQHNEPQLLESCYRVCLDLARQHKVRRISFPSISTGVYGYPATEAAGIALRTVAGCLRQSPDVLDVVYFVQFSDRDHSIYEEQIAKVETSGS